MCELLGMSANVPTDICFSFTGLMLRGSKDRSPTGWLGITFYEGRGFRTFKDPEPSAQSPIAKAGPGTAHQEPCRGQPYPAGEPGCVSLKTPAHLPRTVGPLLDLLPTMAS